MSLDFKQLNIAAPILKALATEGYTHPTPIQERSIPIILAKKDLIGCAQTGTGKTAAFAIPVLQLLHTTPSSHPHHRKIRALVLTPTRELAIQIGESFAAYGQQLPLKSLVIFGGVPQGSQIRSLKNGVDILIATPGRLIDLYNQGYISLQEIKIFVLDEADRMLDMGFIHDVKRIVAKLPVSRQTLFFSATMPAEIRQLANTILTHPEKVEVAPVSSAASTVRQSLYYVNQKEKLRLLVHLLKNTGIGRVLVFSRTKHGADKLAKSLYKEQISAEAIHGNKTQNARQRALYNFKSGKTQVLVATDIAARGIDIDNLEHVINLDLPDVPETYVHRIGRTGRAGNAGTAIAFCDAEEVDNLKAIQKLIGFTIPVVEHPLFPASVVPPASGSKPVVPRRTAARTVATRSKGRSGHRDAFARHPEAGL